MGDEFEHYTKLAILFAILSIACVLCFCLIRTFSKATILPNAPRVIRCALLWGGVPAILSTGAMALQLIQGDSLVEAINSAEYLWLIPIVMLLGAVQGFVFWGLARKKKATATILQRAIVGLVVGTIEGLALSLCFAIPNGGYQIDSGYAAIIGFMMLIGVPVCLGLTTLFLTLITPKTVLLATPHSLLIK